MKGNKKTYLIILSIMLCISIILLFYDTLFIDNSKTYQISVIASGKSDESFAILKEGAEQAASDMNVNIRFIFLSNDNDDKEQSDLIKRESQNEVDAIIISPIESDKVLSTIHEVSNNIPIVIIQSLVKTKDNINNVSCDEFDMGQMLAQEALKNIKKNKNILVITDEMDNTRIDERYDGIISRIDESEHNYLICNIGNMTDNDGDNFIDVINDNDIGAAICIDSNISEEVAELKKKNLIDKQDNVLLFGVGNTNRIISLLDEEILNGTAVQNEFNIGYIGVKNAVSIINGQNADEQKIKSTVINSKDMYSKKNERILFQFVR